MSPQSSNKAEDQSFKTPLKPALSRLSEDGTEESK